MKRLLFILCILVNAILFASDEIMHISKVYSDGTPKEVIIYRRVSDDLKTNNPFVIVEKITYDTKGNYIRPKLTGDAAIAQSWIVGTWQAATMRSEQTIKFNRDGSYEFFENGVLDESESGLYYFEQDNGEVVLRVKEVDVDEVGKVKIQFKNKDEFTIEFPNGRLDTVYRFR